ncbi:MULTISPECIES: hypothetical protein [Acidithrix]|uniref:Uncharacterized protein n=1 Tax=Acidithrix ferrooxidans TaxID=1280514 RepID=A0A0D8HME9_9ACTN|nr:MULTISPECIES: hypothetical protein [Acidithrix]KJF19024.1 hypothetical protein AXFE_00610 [Acidithrix ferrooxidans]CAG4900999.1 unnamed protein product [Acidithrix sp. C25]
MRIIEVEGSSYHERNLYSVGLIERLTEAGYKVVVHATLRPRLSDDLSELIRAGASQAILSGSGVKAIVTGSTEDEVLQHNVDGPGLVNLTLRAGSDPVKSRVISSTDEQEFRHLSEICQNLS